MAKKKVKSEKIAEQVDVTKKALTIQDIEEIVDYYHYYGKQTDNHIKYLDIVRIASECIRLRDILQGITDTANDIIESGTLEAELFEDIKRQAEKGLKEKKIH